MAPDDGDGEEEELLRSVALQNARSILLARDRAEEALRAQSEWLRITLASIGDAVISTDAEGRVTFLNGVAESLTGWPQAEAMGRPLTEVFRIIEEGTGRPIEDPALRSLREGVIVGLSGPTTLIARDGTNRPIDDSAAPMRDASGAVLGAVLVFRDITDRKQAEEAMARDALLLASVRDSVVVTDLEGVVTYWNEGATRLFGWTAEEMLRRHYADRFPEPTRSQIVAEIGARVAGMDWSGEFQDYRKDGSRIWIDARVSRVCNPAGETIGILGLAHDITDRKRAEEALREADRRKDEFLAMLAHELRNPLAAVNNAVAVLKLSSDEENRSWAGDVVQRQVKQLARLIDDLLDVSRIQSGKIRLRKDFLDAGPILDQAVESARPLIDERRQALSVSVERGRLPLHADATRVEQIVLNLLTNAAKYTDSGGRIWLTARREGRRVLISVRDDGTGIAPEKLPEMFALFAQGDRSLARSEGGLGIGLTVVRRLAEMHGGDVTAHSAGPNRGSEFVVSLPLAERPAAAESESEPEAQLAPAEAGPGARVLVVDDNVDTARGMARLLKLLGHEVLAIHDGRAAVEAARAFRPGFVLLDIGLPGLDGYEVARGLRQDERSRDAVIIAVSGYGQEDDRRRSRAAGFDHHLVKPVDFDALISLLGRPT